MCEAIPDNNQSTVVPTIADEVIALRASVSDDSESCIDESKSLEVTDGNEGDNNQSQIGVASIINSDIDGVKCNSTAPLIECPTNISPVDEGERSNDCDAREGFDSSESTCIHPPITRMESEEKEKLKGIVEAKEGTVATEEEDGEDSNQNLELQSKPTTERPNAASYMKEKVLEDNGKLNERLKKRWEKRNQERRATATKHEHSDTSPRSVIKSTQSEIYPDVVSFDVDEDDGVIAAASTPPRTTSSHRKCFSDCGPSSYSSPSRRIGILQADGIVYNDALLLQLARQSHPSQHRRRGSAASKGDTIDPLTGEEFPVFQTNEVKIHVYDLLAQDCSVELVEMPFFNCNFPLGRCFKAVNDGCQYVGTGAYHVGLEVNGIEYAYGGNNFQGMSGVFTCVPKQSPGYDFRETIDLGKVHTTKSTWIRIPKIKAVNHEVSAALDKLKDDKDDEQKDKSEASQYTYKYREMITFADGQEVMHSMARDYMGRDYDLLRKNCCTFAHDACLRLGVKEEDIPTWFRNAALVGAQAEDTLTNVDSTIKNVFKFSKEKISKGEEEGGSGFEVIANMGGSDGDSTLASLKVVESSSEEHRSRNICLGIPIEQIDQEIAMRETASWT